MMVRAARFSQVGSSGRGGDDGKSSSREQRHRRSRCTRTGRANDCYDAWIGGQRCAGDLALRKVAAIVYAIKLDGMAQDLSSRIIDGDDNTVALVNAQGGIRSFYKQGMGDMNRIIGTDRHTANRICACRDGFSRRRLGQKHQASNNAHEGKGNQRFHFVCLFRI